MLQPPPPPNDESDKVSEKPLPPIHASASPSEETQLAPGVPQGDELFQYVCACLDKGSSKAEVRKQLIAFGYATDEAEDTVEAVADWRRKNPDHGSIANPHTEGGGNTNMWIGGIICLVGIVVTVGSCVASQHGGSYTIAYGAIIWGAIQFFRGMSQRNQ